GGEAGRITRSDQEVVVRTPGPQAIILHGDAAVIIHLSYARLHTIDFGCAPVDIFYTRIFHDDYAVGQIPRTPGLHLQDHSGLPAAHQAAPERVRRIQPTLARADGQIPYGRGGKTMGTVPRIESPLHDVLLHVVEAPLLDLFRKS